MKKFRIISFILAIVLVAGLFAGCKKEPKKGSGEIVWIVEGTEAADNQEVCSTKS